jgi:predicted esterase
VSLLEPGTLEKARPFAVGLFRPSLFSRGLSIALSSVALSACAAASAGRRDPASLDDGFRHVEVSTLPVERAALADIRSISPDRVALAVAFPPALDPAREHPILITQVTADHYRSNIAELTAYAPTALEQGYVVMTAQGIPWPDNAKSDTLLHRYASVRAALRWLASEIPQSERWPIVLAGFSGGAKISQVLAFSLTLEQRHVAGVFLGGCNEDHSRLLLAQYPAVRERFSEIAYFLSAGSDDRIAPPAAVRTVAEHLRGSGVKHLELSEHPGDHRLDPRDLAKALRWFRELPQ